MLRGNPCTEPERSYCCNAPVRIFNSASNGTFAFCWHCDDEVNDDGSQCTKPSRRYYSQDLDEAFTIIKNVFKFATEADIGKYSQRQVTMERREAFFFGARACGSTLSVDEIRANAIKFFPFPDGMKDGVSAIAADRETK